MRLVSCATTAFVLLLSSNNAGAQIQGSANSRSNQQYEVWASDQSNSIEGQSTLGVKGGFLWIWTSPDIFAQVAGGKTAKSLPCLPNELEGPCNMLQIFPQGLEEYGAGDSPTGNTLGDLPGFGRLHGVIRDPLHKYVTVNLYAPGGGYVGVIDTETKEAIGLFRVTKYNFQTSSGTTTTRSVHMSTWSNDGNYILVDNLNGKAMERINVGRDAEGKITSLEFDRSASVTVGRGMSVAEEATYFAGSNAFGNSLLGSIGGSYDDADMSDFTPTITGNPRRCKENGCSEEADDISDVGRPNNLPICPVISLNNYAYMTMAGGGALVVDLTMTPMRIVGEYSNSQLYGAGCGGVNADGKIFLNAGVAGSGAGSTQSMFAVFAFDDSTFSKDGTPNMPGVPAPELVYQDEETNTKTLGNMVGVDTDSSGQLPGITTRRDSHGAAVSRGGKYVHMVDRIQNIVEAFDSSTYERFTYDLTLAPSRANENSIRGAPSGGDLAPACEVFGVTDDEGLPSNDPAPDLFDAAPDGKYMMVALRGPAPVTVGHAAQGSCPGVGVIKLNQEGNQGQLVTVLRTTNTLHDFVSVNPAGGHPYEGSERSDIHGAIVVKK